MTARYEVLPFGSVLDQAAALSGPETLTVTCSPRHGLDQTVECAEQLARMGHRAVVHLAARMVRDLAHLDSVLARMASAGIEDAFVIGGDAPEPLGLFPSALALLPVLSAHELRPRAIGIAGYPEGHPLIDASTLRGDLRQKATSADYLVTQMCFDPGVLLRWLATLPPDGVSLPTFVGVPGQVDRRRLLEVSMRVGVGNSISVVRKQRGLRHLLGRPQHTADRLHDALSRADGRPAAGIAGFHYFTFNQLTATVDWEGRHDASPDASRRALVHG